MVELENFNMADNSNNHFFQFTIPPTSLVSPVPQPGPYLFQSPGARQQCSTALCQERNEAVSHLCGHLSGSYSWWIWVPKWRHVNVDMNPADNASRGLIGNIFLRQKMLVIGPEFLCKPRHMWPTQTEAFNSVCDEDPEVKKEVKAYFSSVGKLSSPLVDHF